MKGKYADFLSLDENMERWLVFIITDERWKCWGPWASQGQKCVWCNFILFPFLILSKLYWFPSNVCNRKWPFTLLEVSRGWILSRHLCVELRQITTIYIYFFFNHEKWWLPSHEMKARMHFPHNSINLNLKSFIALPENKWFAFPV